MLRTVYYRDHDQTLILLDALQSSYPFATGIFDYLRDDEFKRMWLNAVEKVVRIEWPDLTAPGPRRALCRNLIIDIALGSLKVPEEDQWRDLAERSAQYLPSIIKAADTIRTLSLMYDSGLYPDATKTALLDSMSVIFDEFIEYGYLLLSISENWKLRELAEERLSSESKEEP